MAIIQTCDGPQTVNERDDVALHSFRSPEHFKGRKIVGEHRGCFIERQTYTVNDSRVIVFRSFAVAYPDYRHGDVGRPALYILGDSPSVIEAFDVIDRRLDGQTEESEVTSDWLDS